MTHSLDQRIGAIRTLVQEARAQSVASFQELRFDTFRPWIDSDDSRRWPRLSIVIIDPENNCVLECGGEVVLPIFSTDPVIEAHLPGLELADSACNFGAVPLRHWASRSGPDLPAIVGARVPFHTEQQRPVIEMVFAFVKGTECGVEGYDWVDAQPFLDPKLHEFGADVVRNAFVAAQRRSLALDAGGVTNGLTDARVPTPGSSTQE